MAISSDIVNILGAGSGIDVKMLAQSLAEAEIGPSKERLTAKIAETEAKISAYGYIKTALLDLQNAFKKLDDAADFASITPTVSQPNSVGVSTTTSAQAGTFDLEVQNIATAQKVKSNQFATSDTAIKANTTFKLSLNLGGVDQDPITISDATPQRIVSAINSADWGIRAQLVNVGGGANPSYTIVVAGEKGSANSFTLSVTDDSDQPILDANSAPVLDFDFQNPLQQADDARFTMNGLDVTRSSNQVSDLIDGVTFNLYSATSGAARVDLNRNSQAITDNFKGLVTAYNDLELTLKELGNRDSEIEDVGGALAGNSLLLTLRSTVRGYIINNSSTPQGGLTAARDAGLSFDRSGQLTLDESKLASALQTNFSDVVKIFSAGTNNKNIYSPAPSGVAGDAVVKLDAMLRTTGLINTQTTNAAQKARDYQEELTKLDNRLSQILARYTEQFSVMESFVGNSRSLQASLKSSFDGMMATYTNKG